MKNRYLKQLALMAILCISNTIMANAQSVVRIRVAAAANLRYALTEIERAYESKFKGVYLEINYGASGTFYQQIINGASYDLFLSADDILPAKLKAEGITDGESVVYACGKLAIYGLEAGIQEQGLTILEREKLNRISIANPRTAPYGARSIEVLKSIGMWERLERRIVYGESIAQAAQFAMTGNCEVGFVALSLLLNPEAELKGSYFVIPEEMYTPIAQAGIVLKEGGATQLFEYLLGAECKTIWDKYGYSTAE
ncbi:MAG: molybdate ABC transporter substrate-binding protein [Rikenellaceae bacterium]